MLVSVSIFSTKLLMLVRTDSLLWRVIIKCSYKLQDAGLIEVLFGGISSSHVLASIDKITTSVVLCRL